MTQKVFSLAGKVALVTGASSGLGRHFAGVLAEAGAQGVVGARRLERLNNVVAGIESAGGRALAAQLDVTDPDSIRSLFKMTTDTVGLIDVVVNCAGIAKTGDFIELGDAEWNLSLIHI